MHRTYRAIGSTRALLCLALLGLSTPAVSKPPGGPKTIAVDCTSGKSIQAALADKAETLVIEIEGFCTEKVVITRPFVTLRGTDPALDGIQGPVDLQGELGLVMVFDASKAANLPSSSVNQSVVFQNLSIRNSPQVGLALIDSSIGLDNVWVVDNGNTGAHFTSSSFAVVTGSRFSNNGNFGVRAQRNASFNCDGCEIDGNGNWGISVALNGVGFLADTTVSGTRGAQAFDGGKLTVVNSQVTGTNRAFFSWNAAIEVETISVDGPIWAGQQSAFYATGLTQATNPSFNLIYSGSSVHLEGDPSTFAGNTIFDTFAHGVAYEDAAFDGLQCDGGAGFVCYGVVTANSSTCGCP